MEASWWPCVQLMAHGLHNTKGMPHKLLGLAVPLQM